MNIVEKNQIAEMRRSGMGYGKIAKVLGLNTETVKSHCRRHGLSGVASFSVEFIPGVKRRVCKQCGKVFIQYPGHREKLFCCDACRNKWWNTHLSEVKRKSMYDYTCPTCGKMFSAYGNRHRKYCSHACYITARFGESSCD